MTGQTRRAVRGKIGFRIKQQQRFETLTNLLAHWNNPPGIPPQQSQRQGVRSYSAWASRHLGVALLISTLIHLATMGLLSHQFDTSALNVVSLPHLSVVLPNETSTNEKHRSTPPENSLNAKIRSTRAHFPQKGIASETKTAEEIDTSLYENPEDIDGEVSIVEAPELPQPNDRNVSAGLLRILIYISEVGVVDRIDLIETSLPEDYTTRLILAIKEIKLPPGSIDGKPVKSRRVIEIDYTDP